MKLGKIYSLSLPPIVTCETGVPCIKDCYAMKSYRLYPTVRKAWDNNLHCYLKDPSVFLDKVIKYIEKSNIDFFRWHVGGDIVNQLYLTTMKTIAKTFPKIKFLAFTKKHHLNYFMIPDNLTIIASMWSNWGNADIDLPKAWVLDGMNTDKRIPVTALECAGFCETCGMCWSLKELNRDVVFHKH